MPTSKKSPRKGRPAELDPERLLEVGRTLFAERGFDGTTTRELARRAGCNVAMIAYHFGSKEGLYREILVRHFATVRELASGPAEGAQPREPFAELATPEERRFAETLHRVARAVIKDDRMQKILSRELMSGARHTVQALEKSGGGVMIPLRDHIRGLIDSGRIRPEVDWKLAVISMIGTFVYSCIASPVVSHLYGFADRDAYTRSLCVYLTRTFFGTWSVTARP